MHKKLIIFPFGGNAREAVPCLLAINAIKKAWDVIGFVDDEPSKRGESCCGVKVLGGREILGKFPDAQVLAVPGNSRNYMARKSIIESLHIDNTRFASIKHPSTVIAPDAKVGHNTLLMPNVVISCGVKIGNHCVILPNTVVSHDASIGDYCLVGSNCSVSGGVIIEPACYIGSGAKIREQVIIGEGALIGLGAVVISNIEKNVVAAGNPAKIIRKAG